MSECKCFDGVIEKVEERVRDQLSSREAETLKTWWENKSIFLQGGVMTTKVALKIGYEYRRFKNSGEPYKNKTKEDFSITMSYCPFCGQSLKKDGGEKEHG